MSDLEDLRARVRAQYGDGIPPRPYTNQTAHNGPQTPPQAPIQRVPDALYTQAPITLRIPWSALVSDNDKYTVGMRKGKPILVLTPKYREGKARIAKYAAAMMGSRPPLAVPLSLVARVYLPDNREHDTCNFGKCTHDALEGVVYVKDKWLHRTAWERAGVDVDAPRCELTITPLPEAA